MSSESFPQGDAVAYEPVRRSRQFFHRFTPDLDDGEQVWVFGVVTSVRKVGQTVYLDLRHALGKIQVVAEKARLEQYWDQIRALKKKNRVRVQGTLGTTSIGFKSIFLSDPPITAKSFLATTLAEMEPSSDYSKIATSIIIAQARVEAETFFDQEDYRRVDPRYLSVSWREDHGLVPLKVIYPGFGVPIFLAPSPSYQLLSVLAATGDDRVYCSGTSFTTSFRQRSDANETAIVMGKTLGITLDELIDHARRLLNKVCAGLPGIRGQFPITTLQRYDCALSDLLKRDKTTVNEVLVNPRDEFGIQPFQIVLPEHVTPVEGCVEQHLGDLPIGTIVFHVERILPLAQHVPIRTLRSLGPIPANT